MKPTMYLKLRISTDSAGNQRCTEDKILDLIHSNQVILDSTRGIPPSRVLLRKSDGAVLGEILNEKVGDIVTDAIAPLLDKIAELERDIESLEGHILDIQEMQDL